MSSVFPATGSGFNHRVHRDSEGTSRAPASPAPHSLLALWLAQCLLWGPQPPTLIFVSSRKRGLYRASSRWGHIRDALLASLRGRIPSLVLSPAFPDASDRVPSFRSLGQNHLPAEALVLSRERAEVDAARATAPLGVLPVPDQVAVARLLLAARERYQVHPPAPRRLPDTSPRSVNREPPNLHRPVAGPSAAESYTPSPRPSKRAARLSTALLSTSLCNTASYQTAPVVQTQA